MIFLTGEHSMPLIGIKFQVGAGQWKSDALFWCFRCIHARLCEPLSVRPSVSPSMLQINYKFSSEYLLVNAMIIFGPYICSSITFCCPAGLFFNAFESHWNVPLGFEMLPRRRFCTVKESFAATVKYESLLLQRVKKRFVARGRFGHNCIINDCPKRMIWLSQSFLK